MGQAVVISNPTGRLSREAAAAAAAGSGRARGRAGAVWKVGRAAGASMPGRTGGGGDRLVRWSDKGSRCADKTAPTGGLVVGQSDLDVAVTLGEETALSLRRLTTTSASRLTCSAIAAVAMAAAGVGSVISATQATKQIQVYVQFIPRLSIRHSRIFVLNTVLLRS